MDNFIVKRRETIVIPKEVETGRNINKLLNVIFLTWSVLTIILYFSGASVPDNLDVGVSLFAIGISICYQVYKYYMFRKSEVNKVFDDPDEALKRKNANPVRRTANIQPVKINNVETNFLNLNEINPEI